MRSGRWVDNPRDTAFLGDPPSEAEISLQLVTTIQTDTGQTELRFQTDENMIGSKMGETKILTDNWLKAHVL